MSEYTLDGQSMAQHDIFSVDSDGEDSQSQLSYPKLPSFISNLWAMVDEPTTDDIISWSTDGKSFFVHDKEKLQHLILPLHFKHSNFTSFIRQLNLYNFVKVGEVNCYQWYHPNFRRGYKNMLFQIKRRVNGKISKDLMNRQAEQDVIRSQFAQSFNDVLLTPSGGGAIAPGSVASEQSLDQKQHTELLSRIDTKAMQAVASAYAAVTATRNLEEELAKVKLHNEYLEKRVRNLEYELELGKQVQLQMSQRHDDLVRQVQGIISFILNSSNNPQPTNHSSNSNSNSAYGMPRRISIETREPSPSPMRFQLPAPNANQAPPPLEIPAKHIQSFDFFNDIAAGSPPLHHNSPQSSSSSNAHNNNNGNNGNLYSNLIEFPLGQPGRSNIPDSPPGDENQQDSTGIPLFSSFDDKMEISPPSPQQFSPFEHNPLFE